MDYNSYRLSYLTGKTFLKLVTILAGKPINIIIHCSKSDFDIFERQNYKTVVGGNFLHGNSLGGDLTRRSLIGGNFPGGSFSDIS